MRWVLLLGMLMLMIQVQPSSAPARGPIIDVHRHASWPGSADATARTAALAEMDANGIMLSLLFINEPGDLAGWLSASPGRFIGGPAMPCPTTKAAPHYRCFADVKGWPDLDWLRKGLRQGQIGLLGEMLFVYAGVSPDDPRMAPYWTLAARYDVPVAVHVNRGPGPTSRIRRDGGCCPNFDGELGNPALLRPILKRHSKLRIILQHVGTGTGIPAFDDETFALLRDYSNVLVDLSILNSVANADTHEQMMRRLIDAGFGDRILFGTDGQPAAAIIQRIDAITWLTPAQRRAIYYDNAARFLRLTPRQIAAHHRGN